MESSIFFSRENVSESNLLKFSINWRNFQVFYFQLFYLFNRTSRVSKKMNFWLLQIEFYVYAGAIIQNFREIKSWISVRFNLTSSTKGADCTLI